MPSVQFTNCLHQKISVLESVFFFLFLVISGDSVRESLLKFPGT